MKIYCSIFNQHENKQSSIILDIFDTNYKSEGLDQSKLTNSIEDCQKLQSNFDSGYNLLLTIERSIVSLKNWVDFSIISNNFLSSSYLFIYFSPSIL